MHGGVGGTNASCGAYSWLGASAKVHAFRLSTDFALPSLQQTGREGDWVVTEGAGSVRIVPAGDFDKTYAPSPHEIASPWCC